eukprot:TRINITY_DN13369_c0_g1_i9.p1 TRINITY_DN13369_c0_g1~~TRINITY_DN13369_c0_g1_i9.p1  ORF type:complete len:216 (-),score=73.30 TRINITY_DN13369_c0_g1_i9:129-776(-)
MSSKRQKSKAYKLDVKYEAKKASITILPDHSIHQLKQMIHSQFNLKPEEQFLLCNGKPLCASDNITLKQAKIPNGSKITANRIASSPANTPTNGKSAVVVEVDETFKKLENIVKNASEVIKSVHKLEKERRRLQNEEDLPIQGDPAADYKRLKFECGKNGEELIRLLESLDQMTFAEGQTEHRARRKQVATKLNYVLDQNDKIIEKLTLAIENKC